MNIDIQYYNDVEEKLNEIERELLDYIKTNSIKKVVYSFSGGKDSQLSVYFVHKILTKHNLVSEMNRGNNSENGKIDEFMLFINTMAYEESIVKHAEYIASVAKVVYVQIIKDIREYLKELNERKIRRELHMKIRPCQVKYIITPLNTFAGINTNKNYQSLIVWGGNPSQKISRKTVDWWIGKYEAYKYVHVCKPLYALYRELPTLTIENIKYGMVNEGWYLWEGYNKGKKRTACINCPYA